MLPQTGNILDTLHVNRCTHYIWQPLPSQTCDQRAEPASTIISQVAILHGRLQHQLACGAVIRVDLEAGQLSPAYTKTPIFAYYTAIPKAATLRSRSEAASSLSVATYCQRNTALPHAESLADNWDADPPLPGNSPAQYVAV